MIVFDQEEYPDLIDIPETILPEIQTWQWKFRTKQYEPCIVFSIFE